MMGSRTEPVGPLARLVVSRKDLNDALAYFPE